MGDAGVDLLDAGPDDLFRQRRLLGHVAVSFFLSRQTLAPINPPTGLPVDTPIDTPAGSPVDRL
jgi:hypothetical protein